MLGTIDQYLDDVQASFALALSATKELLPASVKQEEQRARMGMQGPVWGMLAERTALEHRTADGLITKSLLEALAGMSDALTQAEGARLHLAASVRMVDLSLGKHRER